MSLRRGFGFAVGSMALAVTLFLPSAAVAAPVVEPQHIAGGIQIPEGPLIHVFAPGPKSLGFQGKDIEPSTMTDFRGFEAMAYINGTATDSEGNSYVIGFSDMRVYSGTYVGVDGQRHHGTFAFI